VIGIHAELTSEEIGKSELDERVLTVMREAPRHLFVPAPAAAAAYEDTRCLSGSIRRSHSHSWSHS
jgi:protein-L-isoaspartate(D-aspartate) O-methyltransferase